MSLSELQINTCEGTRLILEERYRRLIEVNLGRMEDFVIDGSVPYKLFQDAQRKTRILIREARGRVDDKSLREYYEEYKSLNSVAKILNKEGLL
jgi:hypothetical protein